MLSWPAPDNAGSAITGYRVYRSASSGGPYTLIGSPTLPNFTDPTPGSTAFYRVTAVNAIGEGPYCSAVSPTPPPPTACSTPGIKVLDDVNPGNVDNDSGQNTPPDPRVNIKQLYIAEPFVEGDKLVFTLKVAPSTGLGMTTPPPNSQWFIVWDRIHPEVSFDRWYVGMRTDVTGAATFEYGKWGVPIDTSGNGVPDPNSNTPSPQGAADSGSYNVATGVIIIKLSKAHAENITVGQGLSNINVRTYFNRPDPGQRSQNNASDITDNGNYAIVGNASCQGISSLRLGSGDQNSHYAMTQSGSESPGRDATAANSKSAFSRIIGRVIEADSSLSTILPRVFLIAAFGVT